MPSFPACARLPRARAETPPEVGAVRLVLEQDTGGDTALRLAWQKKHHSIAAYLLKSWVRALRRRELCGGPRTCAACGDAVVNTWGKSPR